MRLKSLQGLQGQEQRGHTLMQNDARNLEESKYKTVPPGSYQFSGNIQFPSKYRTLENLCTLHGIFSSSSYDDEFGVDLNNLASTVEVSPVATKRINIIHPQSLIIVFFLSDNYFSCTNEKQDMALMIQSWVVDTAGRN
ncbi:hypothetical protein Tco_0170155 [Tanacetum coccineum]